MYIYNPNTDTRRRTRNPTATHTYCFLVYMSWARYPKNSFVVHDTLCGIFYPIRNI